MAFYGGAEASVYETSAAQVTYDNTESGLTATDVQAAIDELAAGTGTTYVASETAVGTWIDGSTIYRKCFTATGSFNTSILLDATLGANKINIINSYGSIKPSVNEIKTLPVDSYISGTRYAANINANNNGLYLGLASQTVVEYIIVVEYIKIA